MRSYCLESKLPKIKQHFMKAYEGTVITLIAPCLALAAVVGSEWSAPRAARFNNVKTVCSTH
jgi:hypothetical protein